MQKTSLRQHARLGLWTPSLWVLFVFFTLLLSPLHTKSALAQTPIPTKLESGSLPVLKYMEAMLDDTSTMDITQIQALDMQGRFVPFNPKSFTKDQGALWLKFKLEPQNLDMTNPAHALLLDLGQGVGSNPKLYSLEKNHNTEKIQWVMQDPSQGSVFLLPFMDETTNTVYIRLEGIPGIWFAPHLRTPHNMATAYELFAKPAAIVALFVVMLLCLLRGFTEKGQWRYWAALYTAVNLFYAFYGVPIKGLSYVPMANMLQAMAPGVALILFAHMGRHILKNAQAVRSFTLQFTLLTLIGIGLALLPLLPGFAWTLRYLDLWPVLMLLFVPTALGAWISGIGGAKRYFVACVLPPLSLAAALLGLYEPAHFASMAIIPTSLLASLPLCGLALGALVLAGTTSMKQEILEKQKNEYVTAEETIEDLLEQDPNLRLVPAGGAQSIGESESEAASDDKSINKAIQDLEEQLRWSIEQLLREVVALESCTLPTDARENAVSIVSTTREICSTVNSFSKNHRPIQSLGGTEEHVFDLQSILRQAHDSVSQAADKKNIALSWFMQPDLASCYKGDALQLLFVLRLLLESAIRSTHRGAVHLNVRRVPESVKPGNLLFTITDSGTGKPPYDRSVTALARAWELSASYHGFLGLESNALGASISFTVHYEVCARREQYVEPENKPLPIILVSDNVEERQMWGFFLEKMPSVLEARSAEEALEMFDMYSASLIIFDARMPLGHVYGVMNGFDQISAARNEDFPICMAIYMDAELEKPLLDMGFSYLFVMPVTRKQLCEAVEDIFLRHGDGTQPANNNEFPAEEVNNSPDDDFVEQDEHDAHDNTQQEQADEIIDTGIPILEMAKAEPKDSKAKSETKSEMPNIEIGPLPQQESTVQSAEIQNNVEDNEKRDLQESTSDYDRELTRQKNEPEQSFENEEQPFSKLSDNISQHSISNAIFMPSFNDDQEVTPNKQQDDENYDSPDPFTAEESLFAAYTQNIDSDTESYSRPSPAKDKSNAAYLTSLVDMGATERVQNTQQATQEKISQKDKATTLKIKQAKPARRITNKKMDTEPAVQQHEENPADKPKMRISTKKPLRISKSSQIKEDALDLIANNTKKTMPHIKLSNKTTEGDTAEANIGISDSKDILTLHLSEGTKQMASVNEKPAPKIKAVKKLTMSNAKAAEQTSTSSENVESNEAIKIVKATDTTTIVETVETQKTIEKKEEKTIAGKIVKILKPKKKEEPQQIQEPMDTTNKNVDDTEAPFDLTLVKDEKNSANATEKSTGAKDVAEPKKAKNNKITNKITRLLMPKKGSPDKKENEAKPITLTDQHDVQPITHTANDSIEWVGEPMPITPKPAVKAEQKIVSTKPNIMIKNKTQKSNIEQPTIEKKKMSITSKASPKKLPEPLASDNVNTLEQPNSSTRVIDDAELRGREELRHLRSFLDSSSSLHLKPVQQGQQSQQERVEKHGHVTSRTLNISAVGEPSPMSHGINSGMKMDKNSTKNHALSPIEKLLIDLDTWLFDANSFYMAGNAEGVEDSAQKMAQSADAFGLRTLARLARTVESAARAKDLVALGDLLPELDNNVQRNRAALKS